MSADDDKVYYQVAYDHRLWDAVKALNDAINDAGPHPPAHREIMNRHQQEWPTLWRAIEAIRVESRRITSGGWY